MGDFLKELDLTEGRATGIPTIRKELEINGSPQVEFDTDDDRTYFLVEIPCHKEFINNDISIIQSHIGLNNEEIEIEKDALTSIVNTFSPKAIYILEYLEQGELGKNDIFYKIGVSNQTYNKKKYLDPLLDLGYIEMTIKDKPKSNMQKYRITKEGQDILHEYKNR